MNFKYIILSLFVLGSCVNLNAQDVNSFFQRSESFFKSVVENGKVNYSSIQTDKKEMEELVTLISQISPEKLTPNERKAFLINAYNLLVIKEVVNHYPISSTQKVNGFFEKIKHKVGENRWTLNQIENEQIRKEYNDPRVHFVLNCAAVSCPPVTNFAYFPALLDGQLDAQTAIAINDSNFIYEKNGKNYISNIFKWYKNDFTEKGTVIDFINEYRTQKLNTGNRTIHYPYDWVLNDLNQILAIETGTNSFIQTYTPSSLLKKGQLEVQLYNNLYTQTATRDDDRIKMDLGERQNYFTSLINILYGASENRKWNIGLDINLRSVRNDSEDSSPLKVLTFRKNDINNRSGISSLGPTVKFSPFKNSKFSIKSSLLIPITKDNEATVDSQSSRRYPWFDWNRFTWWSQFFYDKNIGSKWQLFLEGDLLFRFAKPAGSYADNNPKDDILDTPVSSFLSYFPSEKSTIYIMLQYAPRFGLNKIEGNEKVSGFNAQGDYAQAGVGFKYQISSKIGLEVLYTNCFTSSGGQGAGNTFNFGIRYIN